MPVIARCRKTGKIRCLSIIEHRRTYDKRKRKDRRDAGFPRRDDDETVVTQRARVPGIVALVRSTSDNGRKESVNREFNVDISIRRFPVQLTRYPRS